MEIFTALGLVLSTAIVVSLHIIYIHIYLMQNSNLLSMVRENVCDKKNHEFIPCCCCCCRARAPLVIRGENLFPSNRLNFHISINSISSSYRLLARKRDGGKLSMKYGIFFLLLSFFFVL